MAKKVPILVIITTTVSQNSKGLSDFRDFVIFDLKFLFQYLLYQYDFSEVH